MPSKRLSVVVTRRLPEVVETRLTELFNAKLRADDTPMTRGELIDAVQEADVLVPTLTDRIDDMEVILSYDPEFRHAQVTTETDAIRARAFSYYFALRQHLPDLPVYSVPD